MAFKNFSKLSTRVQSGLISQLYQLISYYGEIFCPRDRVYLKDISQTNSAIYWLETEDKKISAAAIVDPNYVFKVSDISIVTLGHLVSRRPGQMERILNHIFEDYSEQSLMLFCRPNIAVGIQPEVYDFVPFSPLQLSTMWSELAQIPTDYFNISKEKLVEGLDRKDHYIYLRLAAQDYYTLAKTKPKIIKYIDSYLESVADEFIEEE